MLVISACAAPTPTQAIVFPTVTIPTAAIPTATVAPVAATATPTVPANASGLTPELLKSFTYTLKSLPDTRLTLVNGQANLNDPAKNLRAQSMLLEPLAFGDLNGDGASDAVVDIATNTGGSGTFHELIAILWQNGKAAQAAGYELGDRVALRGLKIESGIISLDYLRHGPKDPFCCPSEHALVTFQFKSGALKMLDQKVITP
jgi:hypothetical protein